MMKVLHIASHSINVGDGALIRGIQRLFREEAHGEVDFEALDIVDFNRQFGELRIEEVDFSPFDLVLVGGGGTIDGSGAFGNGMAFPMSANMLRQIEKPIAFVALGYNLFPGQVFGWKEGLSDVLEACAEGRIPFSVRNDGSLGRLRDAVGSAAEHVVEVPDPGFFVDPDTTHAAPQMCGDGPRVILQLAGDNLHRRIGGDTPGRMGRIKRAFRREPSDLFLDHLAALIEWLAKEHGTMVVIAPHITRDLGVTADVVGRLAPAVARKRVRVLGVVHASCARQYFAAYANADLVVGMRGHSVICAVGLRVPCVAISTHEKVDGFMRACGLGEWSIGATQNLLDELKHRCGGLLDSPQRWLQKRDAGTMAFEAEFRAFLRRCIEFSGKRCG